MGSKWNLILPKYFAVLRGEVKLDKSITCTCYGLKGLDSRNNPISHYVDKRPIGNMLVSYVSTK